MGLFRRFLKRSAEKSLGLAIELQHRAGEPPPEGLGLECLAECKAESAPAPEPAPTLITVSFKAVRFEMERTGNSLILTREGEIMNLRGCQTDVHLYYEDGSVTGSLTSRPIKEES